MTVTDLSLSRQTNTVTFLRHGETDWNLQHRWQSFSDIPLNKTGLQQAENIRNWLDIHDCQFDYVFTSPLRRARSTADIVLENSHQVPIPIPSLRELSLGDFEGKTQLRLGQQLGSKYEIWLQGNMIVAAPNGESVSDAMLRTAPLLNLLNEITVEHRVLIIGHQYINMVIKASRIGDVNAKALTDLKQTNSEIDIWHWQKGIRLKRIEV